MLLEAVEILARLPARRAGTIHVFRHGGARANPLSPFLLRHAIDRLDPKASEVKRTLSRIGARRAAASAGTSSREGPGADAAGVKRVCGRWPFRRGE